MVNHVFSCFFLRDRNRFVPLRFFRILSRLRKAENWPPWQGTTPGRWFPSYCVAPKKTERKIVDIWPLPVGVFVSFAGFLQTQSSKCQCFERQSRPWMWFLSVVTETLERAILSVDSQHDSYHINIYYTYIYVYISGWWFETIFVFPYNYWK